MAQDKVRIYEILDMFNEEVGYKGLNNTGKVTDERDDVITRQTFNNWLNEYNNSHDRKIKSRAIDQYINEWHKNDIEKLINDKKVQKKLKASYLRNTVPLFEDWKSMKLLSVQRVSKKYKSEQDELRKQSNSESLASSIEEIMNSIIEEVIDYHFSVFFEDEKVDVRRYINRSKIIEDFINIKKVEEEAFEIVDQQYGTPEYDSCGEIIHVHNSKKRKKSDCFLKV